MVKQMLFVGLVSVTTLLAYTNNNGDNYTTNYQLLNQSNGYSYNQSYVGPYAHYEKKQFKDPLFNIELEFNKQSGALNTYDGFSIKVNKEAVKYKTYNGKYSYSFMEPKGEIDFYGDSNKDNYIYSGVFGVNNQINVDLNSHWRVSLGVEAGITYGTDNNDTSSIIKDNAVPIATNNYMVGVTNGFTAYANVNAVLTYATRKYDIKATIGSGVYDLKNHKTNSYENLTGRFFWTKDLFNYLSITHNNSVSESPDTIMFGFGFPFWH